MQVLSNPSPHHSSSYSSFPVATYTLAYGDKLVGRVKLPRSNHRLGEPVSGVLDLTEAEFACYHVTITLESLERVEPFYSRISPRQVQHRTRDRHAQHHQRCQARRSIGFSLHAPNWASADFETTIGSLGWQLHFDFLIGPPDPPRVDVTPLIQWGPKQRSKLTNEGEDEDQEEEEEWTERRAPEEVGVEAFECAVPIRMYACGYAAGKAYADDLTIPLKPPSSSSSSGSSHGHGINRLLRTTSTRSYNRVF